MCIDPNEDWMPQDKKPETDPNEKYERFYYRFKQRILRGENPVTASKDAPSGFHRWMKSKNRIIK